MIEDIGATIEGCECVEDVETVSTLPQGVVSEGELW